MRLHDRYLFRELLTPLACCLGGFLVFWISYFFFTELGTLQEHKLGLLDALEYAAAMLPGFFVMVLPITLLLALLYALTNHARHHEITALRAAGVSLWRLCAPYFVVGLAASGVYFALNEVAVPRGTRWAEEILSRHLLQPSDRNVKTHFTKIGFRNTRARRNWQMSEYDAATTRLSNPVITWTLPDGSQRELRADYGLHTNGVWTFFNAKLFTLADAKSRFLPQPTAIVLPLPEFAETPRQILLEIRFSDTQTLRGSRNADIPLTELWEYLRYDPIMSAEDAAALFTKFHGRLALPWTCLVVVLIAIPFGAPAGRRNLFFGVAGSIFICFAFFVLQQVSLAFGINGHLPPWLAAWLPNLFFAALGTVMILRTR